MKKIKILLILMIAVLAMGALLAACTPEAVSFTVTYNTNGGSAIAAQTLAEGSTVTAPDAPTKADAVFDGWYKDASLTQTWNFTSDTLTADTTLFARWADAAYVTVADGEGDLVLVQKLVKLIDKDADGKYSIDEVLFQAHESAYTGGAAAGYATETTVWGLGITKLWGDDCGSYGYYLDNAMAWSLADEVAAGEYLYAYVFTDPVLCPDAYSYFDANTAEVAVGTPMTLTLTYNVYVDWDTVPTPAAGVVIMIDGVATAYTTDADGKAILTFAAAETYTVSAASDTLVLVPPVCIVKVG